DNSEMVGILQSYEFEHATEARRELNKLVQQFEQVYIKIKGRVKAIDKQKERPERTTSLPIINLPQFSGHGVEA
ncbi:hypothetical protein, partial [Klebsiella pneumoniae]|uniref:hypothetical protein n=1 Tax=Klebsiella pneumoniae TaxID=573 RepID=UPI0040558601